MAWRQNVTVLRTSWAIVHAVGSVARVGRWRAHLAAAGARVAFGSGVLAYMSELAVECQQRVLQEEDRYLDGGEYDVYHAAEQQLIIHPRHVGCLRLWAGEAVHQ